MDAIEAGREVADPDLDTLNEALAASPIRHALAREGHRFRLETFEARRDWNWVRARLAAQFADLLTSDPSRLRRCMNADCRWVFYDESKSRTRRWCADVCSNLFKVRRYRERERRSR